jgi:large subunit ribosomal protein L2
MEFKTPRPKTSSQRHLIRIKNNELIKRPVLKKKIKKLINTSGRNNTGRITVRHKGGGHKQRYREINFYRIYNSTGITTSIEYDPNRNSNIASIFDIYKKDFFYIIAPRDLKIGDIIKSGSNAEPKIGHSLPISNIPVGSYIFGVSTKINKPSQISRAAGTFSTIKEKTLAYAKIELSSGEHKWVPSKCYATVGRVSNELKFLSRLGKAGRTRWLNIRPTVRGVAMNPIDHPHGGGEGKKSGKGKTLWGKFVKRGSTSRSNKINSKEQK